MKTCQQVVQWEKSNMMTSPSLQLCCVSTCNFANNFAKYLSFSKRMVSRRNVKHAGSNYKCSDGDDEATRTWCGSFIAKHFTFTSADYSRASKIIKLVLICEIHFTDRNAWLSLTLIFCNNAITKLQREPGWCQLPGWPIKTRCCCSTAETLEVFSLTLQLVLFWPQSYNTGFLYI